MIKGLPLYGGSPFLYYMHIKAGIYLGKKAILKQYKR